MSKVKGMMVTCKRCGREKFLKFICTEPRDGGFSAGYDKYEELPDDWLYTPQMGDLCPECANEFKRWVTKFMNGNVAPAWQERIEEVEPSS